jgi:D-alanine-D-alanine ligase
MAQLQIYAKKACRATNVKGLTRVDFFLDRETGNYYLNELNTVPDFTLDSMFPSLWNASSLTYSDLIDTVIDLALKK